PRGSPLARHGRGRWERPEGQAQAPQVMARDARRLAALEREEQPGRTESDDQAPERGAQQMEQGEQRQADRAVLGVEAEEPERLVQDPRTGPQARSFADLRRKRGLSH